MKDNFKENLKPASNPTFELVAQKEKLRVLKAKVIEAMSGKGEFALDDTEQELLKMRFGLSPYEKKHTLEEIGNKLFAGIKNTLDKASMRRNRILTKLTKKLYNGTQTLRENDLESILKYNEK